jgi:hypothetical protein
MCVPASGSTQDVLDVLAFNGGVFGLGYGNCPTFQCIVDLANGGIYS